MNDVRAHAERKRGKTGRGREIAGSKDGVFRRGENVKMEGIPPARRQTPFDVTTRYQDRVSGGGFGCVKHQGLRWGAWWGA